MISGKKIVKYNLKIRLSKVSTSYEISKDFNKIYNFKVQLSKDSEQNQHRHQQNIYDL